MRRDLIDPHQVVGSFILGTQLSGGSIDVTVEVPGLAEKDYKHGEYHRKRAALLESLRKDLGSKSAAAEGIQLCVGGHARVSDGHGRGVVVVRGTREALGKKLSKVDVRLIPIPPADVLPVAKMARRVLAPVEGEDDEHVEEVLEDALLAVHLREQHAAISSSPGIAQACVLIKLWLSQRGMSARERQGQFNAYHATMLLSHLFNQQLLGRGLSSYQVFRCFLEFIASTDLTKSGVLIAGAPRGAGAPAPIVTTARARQAAGDGVVIVDQGGFINIAHRVTRASYRELQAEVFSHP